MNFHETIMGKRFFEHQLPQLIKALQDISANQSRPAVVIKLPVEPPAQDFLETLYLESAVFEPVGMLRQYTQAAAKAQKGFFPSLSTQGREACDDYQKITAERCEKLTERAYRLGFQTAVQLMVCGLSTPAQAKEEVHV